ncbi:MAG TPA: SCO family protein, partial [Gaiellaceae bacterium]|nr:SCO family protein [Gaiellaceae bacterium]
MKRLLAVALVFVVAGCGSTKHAQPPTAPASSGDGFVLKPPVPAPSFLLRDQSAKLVGPQQDRGHWTIVTFLYTHCPDVCPLVTNQLVAAQRVDSDLRVIAVSVDPKRDTPSAVRTFLSAHRAGPRFRFVIGSRAALARVWKTYHVASQPGPKGTVEHSTFEILVDPTGHERVFFDA